MIDTKELIWYDTFLKGGGGMPRSEALKRAQEKYQSRLLQVKFWLNRETEGDIADRLDEVPNKAEYLKNLIRKDIRKGGE